MAHDIRKIVTGLPGMKSVTGVWKAADRRLARGDAAFVADLGIALAGAYGSDAARMWQYRSVFGHQPDRCSPYAASLPASSHPAEELAVACACVTGPGPGVVVSSRSRSAVGHVTGSRPPEPSRFPSARPAGPGEYSSPPPPWEAPTTRACAAPTAGWRPGSPSPGSPGPRSTAPRETSTRVRESAWYHFDAGTAWFDRVAWDIGLAALSAGRRRLAVLAATDTD